MTDIAVLCTERELSDEAVRILYEHRVEFNYLERSLLKQVAVDNGVAKIAEQAYRVVIIDRDFDPATVGFLEDFRAAGGTVIDFRDFGSESDYLTAVCKASQTVLDIDSTEHLRMTHVKKYGVDIVFLSNEGETPLTATIRERVTEIWNCEAGIRPPHSGDALTLELAPRRSVHLILA